jgi:hypothetical protein
MWKSKFAPAGFALGLGLLLGIALGLNQQSAERRLASNLSDPEIKCRLAKLDAGYGLELEIRVDTESAGLKAYLIERNDLEASETKFKPIEVTQKQRSDMDSSMVFEGKDFNLTVKPAVAAQVMGQSVAMLTAEVKKRRVAKDTEMSCKFRSY